MSKNKTSSPNLENTSNIKQHQQKNSISQSKEQSNAIDQVADKLGSALALGIKLDSDNSYGTSTETTTDDHVATTGISSPSSSLASSYPLKSSDPVPSASVPAAVANNSSSYSSSTTTTTSATATTTTTTTTTTTNTAKQSDSVSSKSKKESSSSAVVTSDTRASSTKSSSKSTILTSDSSNTKPNVSSSSATSGAGARTSDAAPTAAQLHSHSHPHPHSHSHSHSHFHSHKQSSLKKKGGSGKIAPHLHLHNPPPQPPPPPQLSLISPANGISSNLVQFISQQTSIDDTPNRLVYKRIESVIEKMQEDASGVPIRTVKSFMSKIPSVFTGTDLIQWLLKKIDVEDTLEALHFAHLIASHGYMFPIDDHILTVKNDGTFFRFQTPHYWPSNTSDPENNDYAVYLCKRTMQNKTRLELADYEAENLAKLQKLLSKKWEFIYMQAEAQIKVDKKRDKMERKILDSQERAFWDVHRPAPGCVNTTEVDIRKTMRNRRIDFPQIGFFRHSKLITPTSVSVVDSSSTSKSTPAPTSAASDANSNLAAAVMPAPKYIIIPSNSGMFIDKRLGLSELEELKQVDNLKKEQDYLKRRLERRYVKASKVSESYTNYFEQYIEFDPFLTQPDPSNPWITDSTDFWDMEKSLKDIPQRRVRRWGFSIHELLKDPSGRELFRRFLEKEYSSENLRFYEVCSELRYSTNKDIQLKVENIYNEFLAPCAHCPINIDSRVMAITKSKMETPDRHTYDEAREHIFNLMTRDSYNRFLRSDIYRDSLTSARKKVR